MPFIHSFIKSRSLLLFLILPLFLLSCQKDGDNTASESLMLLTGASQVAAGVNADGITTTDTSPTSTTSSSSTSSVPEVVVGPEESYFRVKLQDDPLEVPENYGLLHFVLDFESISHYIYSDRRHHDHRRSHGPSWGHGHGKYGIHECHDDGHGHSSSYGSTSHSDDHDDDEILQENERNENFRFTFDRDQFDSITLYLDEIEAIQADGTSIFTDTPDASITIFEKARSYAPILNNLELPAGDYTRLIIHLSGCVEEDDEGSGHHEDSSHHSDHFRHHRTHHRHPAHPHSIQVDGESYPLEFHATRLTFRDSFHVESGKLTTLNAKPLWPKLVRYHDQRDFYTFRMRLVPTGYTVKLPVEKIWIHMTSISVTDASGNVITLARGDTTFDLLSLRDTAVILVGNEMVPAGTYSYFTIHLDPDHAIQVEGESLPLTIVNEITTSFTVPGPFVLRGGRISEIILDFDPNLSVYSTRESGYVLDPEITVASILSMTPHQDARLRESLGVYANPVTREAGVIFEGTVDQLQYITAPNLYNQSMIYQNMSLSVTDRLRGEIADPSAFPLRVIGGKSGDLLLKFSHMPVFSQGEDVLLFLKKMGDRYVPVRGDMGKIHL